jgi:hypothetical protein
MGEACSTDGKNENAYKIFVKETEGRDQLEDLGVVRNIILEWIFGK